MIDNLIQKIQAKWDEMQNDPDQSNQEHAEFELFVLLTREPLTDKKGSLWKDTTHKAVIVKDKNGIKRVLVPLGNLESPGVAVYEFLDASQGPSVDRRKPYEVEYLGKKYQIIPTLGSGGHPHFWGVIPESTGIPLVLDQFPPRTKGDAEDCAYKHARGKQILVSEYVVDPNTDEICPAKKTAVHELEESL